MHDVTNAKLPNLPPTFSEEATAGDIDNDGDLDIFVSSAGIHQGVIDFLMLNDGTGGFTVVADLGGEGSTQIVGPNERLPEALVDLKMKAPQFFDSDNDGDVDLFVMPVSAAPGESVVRAWLLLNNGSGRFTDAGLNAMPPGFFGSGTEGELPSVLDLNGDEPACFLPRLRSPSLSVT